MTNDNTPKGDFVRVSQVQSLCLFIESRAVLWKTETYEVGFLVIWKAF